MRSILIWLVVLLLPFTANAAIALDASTSAGDLASWSHTTSGTNRILFVQGYNLTDCGMTATYGGTSMTLVGKTTFPAAGRQGSYLFMLVNPASGSNTVSLSCGKGVGSVSYTGAAQTGQPDSSTTGTAAGSVTAVTMTTTVVASGSWLIGAEADGAGGETGGTGTTIRQTNGNGLALADSNGTVGTGSQSLVINSGTTGADKAFIIASFAPAASAAASPEILSLISPTWIY